MTLVRRIARPLLAASFVTGGIDTLRDPGPRAVAADKLNLPDAEKYVKINAGAMVVGGLMLATNRLPRLSAAVLAASLVPTTAAGHRFWEETDPAAKKTQRIHFTKNLGLLGGLILATVDTEGRESIPHRAKRTTRKAATAAASATTSATSLTRHALTLGAA